MIIFLSNYFSYCNIVFLHKKSEAVKAIKLIFQMWLNTTFYSVKKLHIDNRGEYVISELQSFLREQKIIHKTSTPYIYQQNGCAKQLNYILLEKI